MGIPNRGPRSLTSTVVPPLQGEGRRFEPCSAHRIYLEETDGSTDWLRVPLVIGLVLLSSPLLALGIKYDSTHRWPWQ
jgi:hypothetical protein